MMNKSATTLSTMSLGTVQFGMDYGIANINGKPSEEQVHEMLASALDLGINSLDTAAAYGDSEVLIGRFIKSQPQAAARFHITSKIFSALDDGASEKALEKELLLKSESSLKRLNLECLDFLLLHRPQDLLRFGNKIATALRSVVLNGYAKQIGVSVYNAEEIEAMMRLGCFNVVQLPLSLFDQKLVHSGLLEGLAERKFTVFVRSVFAQGLFFLDPEQIIDPQLREYALPHLKRLREYCKREGVGIAEYAIAFVRALPGISSLVLGADTVEQLRQNARLCASPPLSDNEFQKAAEAFRDVPFEQIMQVLSRSKT